MRDRYLQQGECDFLILHPVFAMLSIETKPGDVHYDGITGRWHRSDCSSLGKVPYLQAQQSSFALHSILRQRVRGWSDSQFAHGHAVVFSEADYIQGRLPSHALPLITLSHGDIKSLPTKLQDILAHCSMFSGCTSARVPEPWILPRPPCSVAFPVPRSSVKIHCSPYGFST